MDDRSLVKGTAVWSSRGLQNPPDLMGRREEAEIGGARLFDLLRTDPDRAMGQPLTETALDVLRAACAQLDPGEAQSALRNADLLYTYLVGVHWPGPDFDERAELVCDCSSVAWRAARRAGIDGTVAVWWGRFGAALASPSPLRFSVDSVLENILRDPLGASGEGWITEPEVVAGLCLRLDSSTDSSPHRMRDVASALARILREGSKGLMPAEWSFFTGEAALRSGVACRMLSLRHEARSWLDRADAAFAVGGMEGDGCRTQYQRLAVDVEDHFFERVLAAAPVLASRFSSLGMRRDVLKTRILLGVVHKEMGALDEAMELLGTVCRDAEVEGETYLLGIAAYDLMQIHCLRGDAAKARAEAEWLLPLLHQQQNLVGVAKVLWGLGYLLAGQNQFKEAMEVLRAAQNCFVNLEMRADAAAIHLVVAELALGQGKEDAAVTEIRAALSIIEDLGLFREGVAAIALLQESLKKRRVNRKALRELRRCLPASAG